MHTRQDRCDMQAASGKLSGGEIWTRGSVPPVGLWSMRRKPASGFNSKVTSKLIPVDKLMYCSRIEPVEGFDRMQPNKSFFSF
eukprot:1148161-Pelagomonas_calceolata.AAC.5